MMTLHIYSVPRALASARKVIHSVTPYPANLTTREVAILQMIADGVQIKEISFEANVTDAAVRMMLASIRQKAKAKTTYEAVAWAFRNQVIQ